MPPRKRETFDPVTMGHIRGHGVTRLLVYCTSGHCHHGATLDADWLPNEAVVRDLCPRMVCAVCGNVGGDVRPDWSQHTTRPAAGRGRPL